MQRAGARSWRTSRSRRNSGVLTPITSSPARNSVLVSVPVPVQATLAQRPWSPGRQYSLVLCAGPGKRVRGYVHELDGYGVRSDLLSPRLRGGFADPSPPSLRAAPPGSIYLFIGTSRHRVNNTLLCGNTTNATSSHWHSRGFVTSLSRAISSGFASWLLRVQSRTSV